MVTVTILPTVATMGIEILILPAMAGLGLALAAGPLGAFVVWRRMAYFSDATAHAAVLGVALALALHINVLIGVVVVALVMALLLTRLSRGHAGDDTNLGVMAHSALALGLVAIAFVPGARGDMTGFLFGEILAVGARELMVIWGGAMLIVAIVLWQWHALLLATVSEELATSEGLNPQRLRLVLTLVLALVVAVGLKSVGALLIGAMLVIPAATARAFARSPEQMAFGASVVGAVSVLAGLLVSLYVDTPAGPSIVVAAAGMFALSRALKPA